MNMSLDGKFVYVLALQQGRFYVGKSANVELRLENHFSGNGSAWTKKYPPVKVLELLHQDHDNPLLEDTKTEELMMKHGIDKVRGGSYSSLVLEGTQVAFVQKKIWAAEDLCVRCGRDGHFVGSCRANFDVNGKPCSVMPGPGTTKSVGMLATQESKKRTSQSTINDLNTRLNAVHRIGAFMRKHASPGESPKRGRQEKTQTKRRKCQRCGRTSHTIASCYAKTDVYGQELSDDSDDDDSEDSDGYDSGESVDDDRNWAFSGNNCYRCGRESHYARDCYAKYDINGTSL